MLFKPKWVRLLPSNLRPDKKRIRELEKLRVKFSIPHEALEMRVMSSPATTRKVQRNCLENSRIQNPEASHDCRHDFSSNWMMNGGDIYTLSKILGHSSVKVTERYAHLSPHYGRDTIELMGKSMGKITDSNNRHEMDTLEPTFRKT